MSASLVDVQYTPTKAVACLKDLEINPRSMKQARCIETCETTAQNSNFSCGQCCSLTHHMLHLKYVRILQLERFALSQRQGVRDFQSDSHKPAQDHSNNSSPGGVDQPGKKA